MRRRRKQTGSTWILLTGILGLSPLLVGCNASNSGGVQAGSLALGNGNTVITNVGGVVDLGGGGSLGTSPCAGSGLVTSGSRLRRRGGWQSGRGVDHGSPPEDFDPGWMEPGNVEPPGTQLEPGTGSGGWPASPTTSEDENRFRGGGSEDLARETQVASKGTVVRTRGGLVETPRARVQGRRGQVDLPREPDNWDDPGQELDPWEDPDSGAGPVEPEAEGGATQAEGVPDLG